ncbi:XRE family transcriptional regulator [Streptomyces nitrosporeus]|uniref:XRE family transcriptional regulator n=1 Tax=Streptomyces nitrosporeus TaxID=28894 RepID=A0A5J6FCP8_9ACTN|nr:helix-turn-helix transcriptional regulator [Streptomyces nitrosporeus]QEU73284.1 XRE family transcriptional regulator [Streptomyces nitrosporeus]GGZ09238.1 transcriptional regulator [Streptomyces nitrosporeus]
MTPRSTQSTQSARRQRLGTELRRLREKAGLTATESARLLGVSQAQLSNIEASRFGVSSERLRAMARHYSCSEAAYIAGLLDLAGERKGGWWETYRDVLPAPLLHIAELEHHAVALRSANTAHMPGLLQTTDHARELFRQVVPAFSRTEIEHRVSHRLQRQAVLDRPEPPAYQAIIHEAALRVPVGGRRVARAQLAHLLEQGEREHITIQVIPFRIGAYPGSGQTVLYLRGTAPQLDTVSLDQSHGPAIVDSERELETYRLLLARMEARAMTPAESRDLIAELAGEL